MKRAREDDGLRSTRPTKKAHSNNPVQPNAPPGSTMPKVKDALGYLEKVKTKFANKPSVYNQFLDIMKDFKSQAIDTDGVIKRVKTLFKGHKGLILGFNQFLPQGYRIECPDSPPPPPPPLAAPALPNEPQNQPIEFNHAVAYVAKIKQRFKQNPEVYAEFLDILHDYQAKRTIEEVYARVQRLFGNEPDLLEEFKYFLPDSSGAIPLQPQMAKMPKKNAMLVKPKRKMTTQQDMAAGKPPPGGAPQRPPQYRKRKPQEGPIKPAVEVKYPAGSEIELQLFERIRQSVSKNVWNNFVTVLQMSANGICNRMELVGMVRDIFGDRYADFTEKFKAAIDYDESQEAHFMLREHSSYYLYKERNDFSQQKPIGRSYRRYPEDLPMPPCTGRTQLCDQVLNDLIVSTATGSEDYSFKHKRRNQYEENLFQVEDERVEMDMVIENNAAAIAALEPALAALEELSAEQAKHMKIPSTLTVLHVRAIARVYGEMGYETVEMLKRSPATTLPVIVKRLKQKDEEWRLLRLEMQNHWRRVTDQNYHKSLDHRSFIFKQEDRKRLSSKALITNLREMHAKVFGGGGVDAKEESELSADTIHLLEQGVDPLYTYCLRFKCADMSIHEDMLRILLHVMRQQKISEAEQVKILTFWLGFVHHLFKVELPPDIKAILEPLHADFNDTAMLMRAVEGKSGADAAPMEEESEEEERERVTRSRLQATKRAEEDDDDPVDEEVADDKALEKPSEGQDKDKRKAALGSTNAASGLLLTLSEDRKGRDDEQASVNDTPKKLANRRGRNNKRASDMETDDAAALLMSATTPAAQAAATPATASQAAPEEGGEVKPLSLMMDTWALQEKLNPVRRHTRPSKLFFGNNHYYVLFRLHQLLYTRLLRAKELSETFKKQLAASSKRNLKSKKKRKRPEPKTAGEAHQQFKEMLFELLDSSLDSAKFEDECRSLLGSQSYVLFTLDKLVQQLLKQVQVIISSETCMRLLALYQYEFSRSREGKMTLDRSAQLARMYHSNCARLIGDENCCQMEYFEDTRELGIGLVEGASSPEPKNVGEEWTKFLDRYLNAPAAFKPADRHLRPFLLRNVVRFPANVHAHANVDYYNGLESKICLPTYKAHYVEETEDWFLRFKRRSAAQQAQLAAARAQVNKQKSARAHDWVNKRHKRLFPDQPVPAATVPMLTADANYQPESAAMQE